MIASHCSTRVAMSARIRTQSRVWPVTKRPWSASPTWRSRSARTRSPSRSCGTAHIGGCRWRAQSPPAPTMRAPATSRWCTRTPGCSARIQHGPDDSIGFAPSWEVDRFREMGEQHVATSAWRAPSTRRRWRGSTPSGSATTSRRPAPGDEDWSPAGSTTGRSCPRPTMAWAQLVHPDLCAGGRPRAAVGGDRDHLPPRRRRPGAAWRERMRRLARGRGACSNERRFTAHAFEGPGTDLRSACCPARAGWRRRSRGSTDSSTTQHAHRRGVHRARPASAWTARAGDQAARRSTGTVIGAARALRGRAAVEIDADRGATCCAGPLPLDEGAGAAGRARPGRRRGPHRPARHRLLRRR